MINTQTSLVGAAVVINDMSPPANNNEQVPTCTIVRITTFVVDIGIKIVMLGMLVACFAVSAAVLAFNDSISPEADNRNYWSANSLNGNVTALWTMTVTFIAITIELTCVSLRIITSVTKYCRVGSFHYYLGILDIIRYTALGVVVLIALIGYATTREDVGDYVDECDKEYPGDPACDELRELHDNFLAPVVITAATIVVATAGVVWAMIYLIIGDGYTSRTRTMNQVTMVYH